MLALGERIWPLNQVDIEDDIATCNSLLDLQHPPVGLINAVTAHSVVTNRFLNVGCQVFFPCFRVVCLTAMGEAITIRESSILTERMSEIDPLLAFSTILHGL